MSSTESRTSSMAGDLSLLQQFKSFTWPFWAANIMEMFERLAYYGVRVVIPIYIASSEDPAGLHFTHLQKGQIFAWWALFQSLIPLFTGGFSDRYGYKRTIGAAIVLKVAGYILMATQREFYPFLAGCLTLATGTAIFKPGIQATLSMGLNRHNSSVGWGFFYQLVNVGGFLGPPLAGAMHAISWPMVFYGCAAMVSVNLLMLLTYKEVGSGSNLGMGPLEIMKMTFKEFFKVRLLLFVLIMSGVWLMLQQLWDMLPNFIEDWVDTGSLVAMLGLKEGLLVSNTSRGLQIKQEWLVNLNAGSIVLLMVPVAALTAHVRRLTSIMGGIILASLGLILSGYTMSGMWCLLGIFLFSFGEMAASPKMNEYLGIIAPPGKKALYLGYANVPVAIGWFYGSLMGGSAYDAQGDKAGLAMRYLKENLGVAADVVGKLKRTEAMGVLQSKLGVDAAEATRVLWNTYHPYQLWYSFTLIGIASAIGMLFYSRAARKWAESNA